MTIARAQRVTLLCGGVGGAKLAHGFAQLGEAVDLTVVVNVGDDFEHLGLAISPDIDTVLYTLAGVANRKQGWGIEGESWRTLERLAELGGETWFQLGDLDLATHLLRTAALASGKLLSEVVGSLATCMGIRAQIVPATDAALRTRLHTDEGVLEFQHYFVRERCRPQVQAISYTGADDATPAPALVNGPCLEPGLCDAVVIAPSNPFLSIAPILAVPGLMQRLRRAAPRVLAVSPIIAGRAVKGPAAKLMGELGLAVSALGWAQYLDATYPDLIDEWILDEADAEEAEQLIASGRNARTLKTFMRTDEDRRALAERLLTAAS